jgi:UDP-N-acetylglucosamine acyltransferase
MKNVDKRYKENFIHETALLGEGVKLGKGNHIGPYCIIQGETTIGDNNRLEAFVSIGTPAEHRDYFKQEFNKVIIGNNNIFREWHTTNSGTTRTTTIGNNCIFLRGSHVGHDSIVEDKVTLSCNVLVGGESYIMTGANMGLGSVCHQRSVIGAQSMLGMNAVVTRTSRIAPGHIYAGSPARILRKNQVGLNRHGITDEMLKVWNDQFFSLLLSIRKQ